MNTPIIGFLGGLGTTEILLIVLLVLVLFGAKKIPTFARGLGQGIREFKSAANDVQNEVNKETNEVRKSASTESDAKQ
jgi:sec-independent protein translocase protein TatA